MKTPMNYFEDISAIPRVSGNEKAVMDYIEAFAKAEGLTFTRDAMGNMVLLKPAAPGYEGIGAVMLQGHTDMVGAAKDGVEHDFATMPIKLKRDGDTLTAEGTTLGADDGIAVSYMLALLADKSAKHPALECVFTVQEETGLFGAQALDMSPLKAEYMINLDAGPETSFLVSCAGGQRITLRGKAQSEPAQGNVWKLYISGLRSGHSGSDIPRERAGAVKLAGYLLDKLRAAGARLVSLDSGVADNVLAPNATLVVAMEENPQAIAEAFLCEVRGAYAATDPDIAISVEAAAAKTMLTQADTDRAADLLLLLPHGVRAVSPSLPGLVETSSNLAIAHIDGENMEIHVSLRSACDARKGWAYRMVERLAETYNMTVEKGAGYPGWRYQPESGFRDKAIAVYEKLRGEKPKIEGIHAGLECGLFKGKMPWLDIIAIGPNFGGMHTPEEWMSIASYERTYEFIKELLASMEDMG